MVVGTYVYLKVYFCRPSFAIQTIHYGRSYFEIHRGRTARQMRAETTEQYDIRFVYQCSASIVAHNLPSINKYTLAYGVHDVAYITEKERP